jgi:hypothetical protein
MSGNEVVMVTVLGETDVVDPLAGSVSTNSFANALWNERRANTAITAPIRFNFMI